MADHERGARQLKPQDEKKHPDEWEKDLNPDRLQGQNIGSPRVADQAPKSAAHLREFSDVLSPFRRDELESIPIVPIGTRLKQGAVYLDLRHSRHGPIMATGDMSAGPENLYVPKAEVSFEHWNRLLQIFCPENRKTEEKAASGERTEISEELIDKALADSFPASDPPSWNMGEDRGDPAAPGEKPKNPRKKA